jgi:hypothetical protein
MYLEEDLLHDKTSTSSNITAKNEISKDSRDRVFKDELTKVKKKFGRC